MRTAIVVATLSCFLMVSPSAPCETNENLTAPLALPVCESKIQAACYHLEQGIASFRQAKFGEAVASFQVAAAMDLTSPQPRLYLGTCYAQLYVPGGEAPENLKRGRAAIAAFEEVLRLDSKNLSALASIAKIYYYMKDFDKTKEYQRRRIAIQPENSEPFYWIGVINWAICYPRRLALRKDLNLMQPASGDRPDILPPLPFAAREKLASENLALILEGIEALGEAIELNPNDVDAMAYLNLMYREKADLESDPQSRESDLKMADEWVERAVKARKRKAEQGSSRDTDR